MMKSGIFRKSQNQIKIKISLDFMMLHMKVCNKRYLFMCFKSPYSIKKLSGEKAFGTYDKSFCMNFWDLIVWYTLK